MWDDADYAFRLYFALNQPPVLATNTGLSVNEGATATLANTNLNTTDPDGDTVTYTIGTAPVNGTLKKGAGTLSSGGTFTQAEINGGQVTYTHSGTETTADSFTFTASDGKGGAIGSTTFNMTVNPVNDAPLFTLGSDVTVLEDSGAYSASNFLTGATAVEAGQTLTTTVTTNNNVLFSSQPTIDGTGRLTFTPAANAHGSATVTVTVSDNGGTANGGQNSTTKPFTITINPVNDPPNFTTGPDITVAEDAGAQTRAAWATDITAGPNEPTQTVSFTVSNNNNSLFTVQPAINLTGALTFTPAPDVNGQATVTVRAVDDGGTANGGSNTSASKTFTITIVAVNDPPVVVDDIDWGTEEDSGEILILADLRANDKPAPDTATDEADQTLTITSVTAGTGGTVRLQGQAVYFTPAANFHGNATFTYTVQDSLGATATGTVTVPVTPVADTPMGTGTDAQEDTQTTNGLVISRNPVDGAEVTHFQITEIENGRLYKNDGTTEIHNGNFITFAEGNAGLKFTPSPDFNGGGSFNVAAATSVAGAGLSAKSNVIITVLPVNDAPTAVNDTLADAAEDSGPWTIPFAALTGNDSQGPANESWQELTITAVNNAVGGTVALDPVAKTVIFTPTEHFNGPARFDYTVEDNGAPFKTSIGTVTFTVYEVNDAPVGADDTLSAVDEDSAPRVIPIAALVANDGPGPDGTNEDDQELTFKTVSNPTGGTVQIVGEDVVFTLAPNFSGTAGFTYTLEDNGTTNGLADPKTDTVNVSFPVNAMAEAPSVTGATTTAEDTQSGLITITPDAADGGSVTHFKITGITGGTLYKSNGTTQINNADFITTAEGAAGLKFMPLPDQNTPAGNSFGFTVQASLDGGGTGMSPGTPVTITVTEVNDAPTGTDDNPSGALTEDYGTLTFDAEPLLGNDSKGPANESGQTLSITAVSDVVGGTATVVGGKVQFTTATNFFGTASFIYTLSDNGTTNGSADPKTSTAKVIFSITPMPDAPQVTATTTTEDTQSTNGLVITRNALDGAEVTHFQISGITGGQLYQNDGTTSILDGAYITQAQGAAGLKFTPAANLNSDAGGSFGFTVKAAMDAAGAGLSAGTPVTITVTAVNDAPTISLPAAQSVDEDTNLALPAFAVSDVDLGAADLEVQLAVTNGTLTFGSTAGLSFTAGANGDASVTFTGKAAAVNAALANLTYRPDPDYNGTDTLSITVSDQGNTGVGGAQTDSGTVAITVNPVNDLPSFTHAGDRQVLEDSGSIKIGWAGSFSTGPADEASQTFTFTVSNDNNSLFATQPAIDADGFLTFEPAADAFGVANVTVRMRDSGGAESAPITFQIEVYSINDAPSFDRGADQSLLEDAAAVTVANWATSIKAGPANESAQTYGFTVTNDNNALFAVQPALSSTGTLTYTLAANASGIATVSVTLQDNGGTVSVGEQDTSAPQTFTITVTAVNDAPSFTKGADVTVLEDATAQTLTGWATAISAGPADEVGQALAFTVTTDNAGLFDLQPALSSTGELTFTPKADQYGTANVTVTLSDNGGTANGGQQTTAAQSFKITMTPVNDLPAFTKGADVTVLEDSGLYSAAWATGITAGANEPLQTYAFTATTNNDGLFAQLPQIAADGTLTFQPQDDAYGVATVTVTLKDNGGTADGGVDSTAAQTFTITVKPVNDRPTFTLDSGLTLPEDDGLSEISGFADAISAGPNETQGLTFTLTTSNDGLFAVVPQLSADGTLTFRPKADANGSATVTVTLKDDGGTADGGLDTSLPKTFSITVLAVNDAPSFTKGADQTVNEDAGAQTVSAWATDRSAGPADESGQTLSFSVSTDNDSLFEITPAVAADGTLTYKPAANASGLATVTVRIRDNGGTANWGIDESAAQTFLITVTAVNDAPGITGLSAQIVDEDTDLALPAITLHDLDAGAGALKLDLSVDHGTLTLASTAGLTFAGGANGEASFSLTGTVATLNAALTGLTYRPDSDYNGLDSLMITVNDQGNTGTGGAQSAGATVGITVNAVNDRPSFTAGLPQTVNEDSGPYGIAWATNISAGPADEVGQSLSFVVSNDNNSLFATQPSIAPNGTLTFQPAADANGTATVTVQLTDSSGGDQITDAITFLITVTAVNDAPSFTVGANQSVLEDAAAVSIANWATAIQKGPANESAQTLTFSLTTDNAALFAVLPAVTDTGTLTYTLAPNANGSATVTVTLADNGGTAHSGKDTSASVTFTIAVTAVNDAPSFTKGANLTVLEDAGARTYTGWATGISAGPADENAQVLTFAVSTDRTDLFAVQPAISASGELTFTPQANQYGVATLSVLLSDNGGTSNGGDNTADAQSFTVTITGVNDVPAFTKGADVTVLEDSGLYSAAWATGITAGPNEPLQTYAFTATTNNDALFTQLPQIAADGSLTFTPKADAYGEATVTVTLKDNGGTANDGVDTTAAQTFKVTVKPVNDRPSFTKGADLTVLEDAVAQSLTGWASAISAGPNETQGLTFTLTTSNDGLFAALPQLSADGTLTYTPKADANGSATVTITLKDDGGTADAGLDTALTQTFTITVTAVNDVPSFTKGSDQTVNEDAALQTVAGWATNLSAGPADESGQALSFVVTTDNNGLFETLPTVAPNGTLTYQPAANANGLANVTVRIRDTGGIAGGGDDESDAQTFIITVNAVNDGPTVTGLPGAQSVAEDGALPIPAFTLHDLDLDGAPFQVDLAVTNGTLTFGSTAGLSFTAGANGDASLSFTATAAALNAALADLTYRPDPDYYGPDTLTLTVSDQGMTGAGGALSYTGAISITVTPVNDRPSFTIGANQTVNEDSGLQSVAWATTISTGPANESSQTPTFVVTNDRNDLFATQPAIAADGTLTYKPQDDAFGTATVTVRLTDTSGGDEITDPVTFTITVDPLNDAPSFTLGAAPVLLEDAAPQSLVNWATAIKAGPANEADQTYSFTVTHTNPELFSAAPSLTPDGTLSFTLAPNAFGESLVTVTLTDTGGTAAAGEADTSAPQTFTIKVNPVNDIPVVADQTINVTIGQAAQFTVTGTDVEEETLSFSIVTAPTKGTVVMEASGKFIYTGNQLGTDTFTYKANDGTDDSAPATVTVTISPVPIIPVVSITAPTLFTREASITVTGRANPLFFVAVGGQTVKADSQGNWNATVALQEGPNLITATNGTASASVTVTRDTRAPQLLLTASATRTDEETVTLTATTEEGARVEIEGQEGRTLTVTLKMGNNRFSATATDLAGNTTTATVSVLRVGKVPDPVQREIPRGQSGELSTGFFKVVLPGDAVDEAVLLQLTGPSAADAAVRLAEGAALVAGTGDSVATGQQSGNQIRLLDAPATVTFIYDPAQVSNPDALRIYYFDPQTKVWVELGGVIDRRTNSITVQVGHFTTFAAMEPQQDAPIMDAPSTLVKSPDLTVTGRFKPGTLVSLVINSIVQETALTDAQGAFRLSGKLQPGRNFVYVKGTGTLASKEAEVTYQSYRYTDVVSHWSEPFVNRLADRGVLTLYPEPLFKPEERVTRLEFAVMVSRILGLDPVTEAPSFTDTAQMPTWALPEVSAAVKAGIILGYPDGSFGPNALVSRAEMAVMMVRALEYAGKAPLYPTKDYTDGAQIPTWALQQVLIASGHGLITGYPDGSFQAGNSTTRAEAVTMLSRLLDVVSR